MRRDYRIGELAALAGVSPRTLRHYEEQGLLTPARGDNGYRLYGPEQVARLQQVLLYRACGLSLERIGALLADPAHDQSAALREHLRALEHRQQELGLLIRTVQKTLLSLEGETHMTDQERFEGLPAQWAARNEQQFGAEARERYGDKAVDKSQQMVANMSAEQAQRFQELDAQVMGLLRQAMATEDPAGPEARRLCEAHREWLLMTWPRESYSLAAHRGLGQMYVADERFTSYYDGSAGPGAARFLCDSLAAWEG